MAENELVAISDQSDLAGNVHVHLFQCVYGVDSQRVIVAEDGARERFDGLEAGQHQAGAGVAAWKIVKKNGFAGQPALSAFGLNVVLALGFDLEV